MNEWQLTTPVAVIIFNRPQMAQRVYEVLRIVKPPRLFVIADGARAGKFDEAAQCESAREVFAHVEWDCEVTRNYAERNLGCGWRPASGITWVFEQVPEAIILEDDCVPHPTFFRFCEELLAHYRDDERVMHIGGSNFLFGKTPVDASYYFSRYAQCWGWATWRRAWQHFDYDLRAWPEAKANSALKSQFATTSHWRFWTAVFDEVYGPGKAHIWDFQWVLACWLQSGLSIVPHVNLVSNIGFGDAATHTLTPDLAIAQLLRRLGLSSTSTLSKVLSQAYASLVPNRFANQPTAALPFPLQHPNFIIRHAEADAYVQRQNYQGGILSWGKRKLKKLLLN
jgi:hypothetical protein